VAEKGSPNVKPGKMLTPAIAEWWNNFYVSDEISRIIKGTKDYISVTQKAKRLIFGND
jgi:secreted Zn-dependent insulinase-like peptidase